MHEAVIISDLHLGSTACRARLIRRFLENLPETKRLILNGDVLDNTESRLPKSHWKVLRLLRDLSGRLELVWVAGNHDHDAAHVAHLVGADFVPEYRFVCFGKVVLCVHGDAFDDFITRRPLVTWVADCVYGLAQRVNRDAAAIMKRNSKTFLHCCKKVRDGAVAMGADVVICGHTHFAEADDEYANSGCWVDEVGNYVTIDEGWPPAVHEFSMEAA